MADTQLYEDSFVVTAVNSGKYDRVSRLICKSSPSADTDMTLDVNTELYPCGTNDTLHLVLVTTLNLDGSGDDKSGRAWRDPGRSGESTLADMYDYVCRGKIYKFDEGVTGKLRVFISFGGLLMFLEGPFKKLTGLRVDYVYLCMKK